MLCTKKYEKQVRLLLCVLFSFLQNSAPVLEFSRCARDGIRDEDFILYSNWLSGKIFSVPAWFPFPAAALAHGMEVA
ncbi:MAG: hypothetical protein JRI80_04605 [Deltaproteobacteria bacterium]|nr:hypothetical protein [Deltaproteobacteria bacterium]